jgi:mono/diheme cytochrome c family protein
MPLAFLYALLVLLALSATVLPPDGPSTSATGPQAAGPSSADAQATPAVRVYRATCLKCHDTDGKGEIARDVMPKVPDFTDAQWHASRSDAELSRSILEGKGKSMPPMRAKLGPVDVAQMVAFVRAFRGGNQVVEEEEERPTEPQRANDPAPAPLPSPTATRPSQPRPVDLTVREGSQTFRRSCAVCHGGDGRGAEARASLPEIPDFTAGAWHRARTDSQLVVSVLDGKGSGMPPFRDKLSREQVRGLVAFIRSLGPSRPAPAARPSSDDFEARFQQLLAEFEDLRRKSRALSADAAPSPDQSPKPAPPAAAR